MDMESRERMNLQKTREERVREARLAFGRTGYATDRYSSSNAYAFNQTENRQDGTDKHSMERRFRLLRLVTAAMLFLVLSVAFYFDFSYYGFDREFVEQCLQDDTFWTELTEQVSQCIAKIHP